MKPVVLVRVQMEAFCASAEQEVVRLMDALAHVSTDAKSYRLEALRAALAGGTLAQSFGQAAAAVLHAHAQEHRQQLHPVQRVPRGQQAQLCLCGLALKVLHTEQHHRNRC